MAAQSVGIINSSGEDLEMLLARSGKVLATSGSRCHFPQSEQTIRARSEHGFVLFNMDVVNPYT
jgi:hypothetical protein